MADALRCKTLLLCPVIQAAEAWNRVVVKVGTEQDVGRQWCNRLYRTLQKEVALL